jgi:mycofactocin precursor
MREREPQRPPGAAAQPDPVQPADEVLEDLLVEEVSIDGMCGVY